MLRPQIMGILNVTPDSFSDTGCYFQHEIAIARGEELVADGAVIVDIGGEASGPGSIPCDIQTEWLRIKPVIEGLASKTVVSVDTYKASVAERSLQLGAQIINDISALRHDDAMVSVIKDHNARVVLMFSKEEGKHPLVTDSFAEYRDIIATIEVFFEQRIEYALAEGLRADQIILDTGLGRFVSQDNCYSWEIIQRYGELREKFSDFLFLFASSRKGFLGGALSDRDGLSQMTALHAALNGANIIRSHNPAMARDFISSWNAILKSL